MSNWTYRLVFSALNLDSPRDTGLKLSSIALSISFLVKSPSGPISMIELDLGFYGI